MDTDGGPQADGGEQVLINDERLLIGDDWLFAPCLLLEELIKLRKFLMTDDWLLIVDCLHTENAEDTDVRKRTLWVNGNCHQLDSNWKKNFF